MLRKSTADKHKITTKVQSESAMLNSGEINRKNAPDFYGILLKNLNDIQQFNPTDQEREYALELNTYGPLRRAVNAIFYFESNNIVLSHEQKNEIRPLLLNVVEHLSLQLSRYELGPKSHYVKKKLFAKSLVQMLKKLDIEEPQLEITLNHISQSMKFLDKVIDYIDKYDGDSDCEED